MSINKTTYLSNLRAIAILLVVILHVSSIYMSQFAIENLWQWQLVNIIDSGTRICIGLFLMISGALLLEKKIDIIPFLKKRLPRIGIPFIFWTLLYILIEIFFQQTHVQSTLIKGIYFGAAYHFWYVYMLIGIYLFLPIMSVFILNATKKQIEYFLIIWLISLLSNMFIFKNLLPNFNLIYFSGYIGYVVLGYYLHFLVKGKSTAKFIIYYSLSYMFTFLITFHYSYITESLNTNFYQYLDLNIVIMAASFFMIFKHMGNFSSNIFKSLSEYSFGIYFIHPIFLKFIEIKHLTFSTIWAIQVLYVSILVLAVSYLCIYILRKLPHAKLYIG